MATAQSMISIGDIQSSFALYFLTWTGSAYTWTEYTSRLTGFGSVNMTVEQNAYPNAFRMDLNEIRLDNTDGFFNDIDTLDGLLANASEPYGKKFYKRLMKLAERRYNRSGTYTETALFVGVVRDLTWSTDGGEAVLRVISLDARAADQACDGETCNRHPLGSSLSSSPSLWTTTMPTLYGTGMVALYQFREKETDNSTFWYRWFKYRRIFDIIKRTSWALDDLNAAQDMSADIEETPLYTSAITREIASVINIPPDDSSVSVGNGDMRTRAIVWNPRRNVLVCCVGDRIYDYDQAANTYTRRNQATFTAGRQIARAWYIQEADSGAYMYRLVFLSYDVSVYTGRVTTMYCTVLNASTPSGDYGVLADELTLGSDVFPGTYSVREGVYNPSPGGMFVGQTTGTDYGENVSIALGTQLKMAASGPGTDWSYPKDTIWEESAVTGTVLPVTAQKPFYVVQSLANTNPIGLRFSFGQQVAATINLYNAGGRLVFCTWDSGNNYRLKWLSLYDYSTTGTITLLNSAWVPHFLSAPPNGGANEAAVQLCAMLWDDTADNYSTGIAAFYWFDTSSWTDIPILSGATGSDLAWTPMEMIQGAFAVTKTPMILWNRQTGMWMLVSNLASSWAALYANRLLVTGGRLHGLYEQVNYSPNRVFLAESVAGGFLLHSYDGATLLHENKVEPNTNSGDPVNTDMGLGAYMAATQANYPNVSTPYGILFGITANDYPDATVASPAGEYCLWQYANFFAGFVKLLDLSGLSFFDLRSQLAEMIGYVHYYDLDGSFKFKKRERTTGSPSFTFSEANNNFVSARIDSQGWERVLNDLELIPYVFSSEVRVGEEIEKSSVGGSTGRGGGGRARSIRRMPKGGGTSNGVLQDIGVDPDPGEKARWQVVIVSKTTTDILYDLYKLVGPNADTTTPKVAGQSITSRLGGRDIPDGFYLTFDPANFVGDFQTGDTFAFWVYPPQERLEQATERDKIVAVDATSIAEYQRARGSFDNRFITRLLANDFLNAVLAYRKNPHPLVQVEAFFDPTFQPLLTVRLLALGFDSADEFMISGLSHGSGRDITRLTLIKL